MIPRRDEPFSLFHEWQREARGRGRLWLGALRWVARGVLGGEIPDSDAAALATATADGRPSVRMVLVKTVGEGGLYFYTSYESRKAAELDANGEAALVFHWPFPPRQVRFEGAVERTTRDESESYFRSRRRGSQLSAAASRQSAVLADRADLVRRVSELRERHEGEPVPCPDAWGGYRLVPRTVELWEGRPDRLHERLSYEQAPGEGSGWTLCGLEP